MLPNMAGVLDEFSRPVSLGTVTQSVVGFRPVDTESVSTIQAVVQPANKNKINPAIIDWSLDYKTMHSKIAVKVGDFFTENGVKYKAAEDGNYSSYDYYETLFEQVK